MAKLSDEQIKNWRAERAVMHKSPEYKTYIQHANAGRPPLSFAVEYVLAASKIPEIPDFLSKRKQWKKNHPEFEDCENELEFVENSDDFPHLESGCHFNFQYWYFFKRNIGTLSPMALARIRHFVENQIESGDSFDDIKFIEDSIKKYTTE